MTVKRPFGVALLALALALAPSGRASAAAAAGDDGKKEKKTEPAPDQEGHGPGVHPEQKNPLPEIIDLMRKVEEKLADAETNDWTRDEQEKIVKALEGQASAIDKLRELIKQVEEQSQSGGGGGGGQDRKPRQGGEGQKQPKPRQKDEDSKPVNPEQQQSGDKPQDGKRRDQRPERRDEHRPPEDAQGGGEARHANPGDKWGDLPSKQAHEVIDAKQKSMPPEYRKQLEEYYRKLTDPKKN
jgi:hypothetical protein